MDSPEDGLTVSERCMQEAHWRVLLGLILWDDWSRIQLREKLNSAAFTEEVSDSLIGNARADMTL